jgi:hypothetical protein
MTSPTPPRRVEFFERSAEACRRVFGLRTHCVCPICLDAFTREDLDAGRLTLEHVPPASAGGVEMCLTCKDCNNTAGSTVDAALAELAEFRRMWEAMDGNPTQIERRVRISAGGIDVNAIVRCEDGTFRIEVRERDNHPARFAEQLEYFRGARTTGGAEFNLSALFRLTSPHVFVSILRAGYLAAFALLGYRYARHPRLEIVREQIRRPGEHLVSHAAVNFVATGGLDEDVVCAATQPLPAIVSCFRAGAVVVPQATTVVLPFPNADEEDFYRSLAATGVTTERGRRRDYEITAIGWPTGPHLMLDFRNDVPPPTNLNAG